MPRGPQKLLPRATSAFCFTHSGVMCIGCPRCESRGPGAVHSAISSPLEGGDRKLPWHAYSANSVGVQSAGVVGLGPPQRAFTRPMPTGVLGVGSPQRIPIRAMPRGAVRSGPLQKPLIRATTSAAMWRGPPCRHQTRRATNIVTPA